MSSSLSSLIVPWEWKTADAGGTGELDGYGVFFNNIDLGDDVVLPGSCRKTLLDREASGRPWPLMADHELKTSGMIGSVIRAREDGMGVRVRARFSATAKAQDIRTLAAEGHPLGMSMTYEPLQHYPGQKDGRAVRFLKELRLHEFTVTPFPMNPKSWVLGVKAVSNTSWSQFSPGDYTDEQWARACLVDTGQGTAKQRYVLPVKEPSGTVNRNGAHAAAARMNQVDVSAEVRAAAARKLVAIYRRDLGEDPPESLMRMAGMMSRSLDLRAALHTALDLPPMAAKAAVDALLDEYVPDLSGLGPETGGPVDGQDAGTAAATTPDGAPAGTAGDVPSRALPANEYVDRILSRTGTDGSPASLDRLEADVRAALER